MLCPCCKIEMDLKEVQYEGAVAKLFIYDCHICKRVERINAHTNKKSEERGECYDGTYIQECILSINGEEHTTDCIKTIKDIFELASKSDKVVVLRPEDGKRLFRIIVE